MAKWDSELYLKFKSQRTQPAIDLAKRIAANDPQNILDIGCGPGNSTIVLKGAFPKARVLGIDNSEQMVNKAKEAYPDIDFALMDIARDDLPPEQYDVIFSNACLQWVPDHAALIPKLFSGLREGGVLAVQMPMNACEPLFQIADEAARRYLQKYPSRPIEENATLSPDRYYDILSALTDRFDIWESVYYHSMPSIEAMVEWIKGARLRPYLNALDQADARQLLAEITQKAAAVYRTRENGSIIFKFRRFFFTAIR
ncbi:MAG: methyltransferase domain-containing protein [Clostridia bacterium]|nr:methyltransferase domain-containing protein [Clostridia bacterium]